MGLFAIGTIYTKSFTIVTLDKELSKLFRGIELFSIGLLFTLLPFHTLLTYKYTFYREMFAAFFLIAIILRLAKKSIESLPLQINRAVLVIFIWILYLIGSYITDPGVSIYNEDIFAATMQLERFSGKAYVLRNMVLYVPLLVLLSLRGLKKTEFTILLNIILICAPLSIILSLTQNSIFSVEDAKNLLLVTGHGYGYNDYVPYLTFPFITGLYLFTYYKNVVVRAFVFLISLLILGFILFSTSRQSAIFCFLTSVYLLYLNKYRAKYIIPAIFSAILIYCYVVITSDVLVQRYFSGEILATSRWGVMNNGLKLVGGPIQWLIGNGLSSVIYSGPHNNYIRIVQRIGLIGMVLTFAPFVYAFSSIMKDIKKFNKFEKYDHNLSWFIASGVFFTLYHSFFMYPHEDAFNSPYVWLGITLWLVMRNKGFYYMNNHIQN